MAPIEVVVGLMIDIIRQEEMIIIDLGLEILMHPLLATVLVVTSTEGETLLGEVIKVDPKTQAIEDPPLIQQIVELMDQIPEMLIILQVLQIIMRQVAALGVIGIGREIGNTQIKGTIRMIVEEISTINLRITIIMVLI